MSTRCLLPLLLFAGMALGQKPEDKKPDDKKPVPKKDEPKTKAEPSAEELARAYFKSLDRNQDGFITKDEFPGSAEQLEQADKNKDKKLSEEEFRGSSLSRRTEMRRREDQKPVRERHQVAPEVAALRTPRFAALDKDRDGRIGRAEWNGGDDGFNQLDADGDGWLSRAEFAPPPARAEERPADEKLAGAPMQGDSKELFQRGDRNGDGKITKAEAIDTKLGKLFAAIDKDKNGEISEREFQDAYAELMRQASARDEGKSGRKERKNSYTIPFDEWDKDRDGKLSQDEFQGNKEWFPLADRNRDGVLSRPEAETFAREQAHDEFVARYDGNGDGKVTREEFPGTDEVFRRADRNGDGVVTTGER
jgi:Ca2+-binding EF-hand superfamily protein